MCEKDTSMSTKQFLQSLQSSFAVHDKKKERKKKSLQKLLGKLKKRKRSILKSLDISLHNKELQEDLNIVSLHIKKGEKILNDLCSNKH